VALVAAALTFAPALGSAFHLSSYRAGQIAMGGAAGLGLYWVLFVLPTSEEHLADHHARCRRRRRRRLDRARSPAGRRIVWPHSDRHTGPSW